MLTAIVGINWGDEGKGRRVDLLTSEYDVVVRYQGGGNAGHTVINETGKFALPLLPSGIFREDVINILGNGVAMDPESLWNEMQEVMAQGVAAQDGKLTWEPVHDPNHCYYRIFADGEQIASTVACDLPSENEKANYTVLSVDQWGNV